MKRAKILIVDDEKIIRDMLADYLEINFDVEIAQNGDEALHRPDLGHFDLVISDINMPGMPGYELLKTIKARHSHVKVVLITAYNVDDYIRLAQEHDVSNIISKTIPFNFAELEAVVKGLVTGDIFGIEKFMNPGFSFIKEYTVKSSADAKEVREDILSSLLKYVRSTNDLKLVLDEIVTNALYHSPRDAAGNEKYEEYSNITLDASEYIHIQCAVDDEKYGVSIADHQGSLRKETILYKVNRHIRGEGVLDDNGRGMFMSRIFADRLIMNIHPGKKTEIIVLNYRDRLYKGFKPLYINEL